MTQTRWQPLRDIWSEMHRLQDEMNRAFGPSTSGRTASRSFSAGFPAVNVWEDENQFRLTAELPGMQLEDIEILLQADHELVIQGERRELDAGSGTWHRRERGFGRFSRTLTLPSAVDGDKVEARLNHGILEIVLPKREEVKPRRISVTAD